MSMVTSNGMIQLLLKNTTTASFLAPQKESPTTVVKCIRQQPVKQRLVEATKRKEIKLVLTIRKTILIEHKLWKKRIVKRGGRLGR